MPYITSKIKLKPEVTSHRTRLYLYLYLLLFFRKLTTFNLCYETLFSWVILRFSGRLRSRASRSPMQVLTTINIPLFWKKKSNHYTMYLRRRKSRCNKVKCTPAEVGNILSWRLIMKYFLRSFSPFRWFKKGSCQFLAKECAQYWLTA